MRKKSLYIAVASAAVGFVAIMLPEPYSKIGLFLFLIGFVVLIAVGHKAAFRQHKHGILSQYTDPKVFLGMTLSQTELILLISSASLSMGFLAGLAVKVNAL